MIYSNRIIERGLVKLPVLFGDTCWQIVNNGNPMINILSVSGEVKFTRAIPASNFPIGHVESLKIVERIACSLYLEMVEEKFLNNFDEDYFNVADFPSSVIPLFS